MCTTSPPTSPLLWFCGGGGCFPAPTYNIILCFYIYSRCGFLRFRVTVITAERHTGHYYYYNIIVQRMHVYHYNNIGPVKSREDHRRAAPPGTVSRPGFRRSFTVRALRVHDCRTATRRADTPRTVGGEPLASLVQSTGHFLFHAIARPPWLCMNTVSAHSPPAPCLAHTHTPW